MHSYYDQMLNSILAAECNINPQYWEERTETRGLKTKRRDLGGRRGVRMMNGRGGDDREAGSLILYL